MKFPDLKFSAQIFTLVLDRQLSENGLKGTWNGFESWRGACEWSGYISKLRPRIALWVLETRLGLKTWKLGQHFLGIDLDSLLPFKWNWVKLTPESLLLVKKISNVATNNINKHTTNCLTKIYWTWLYY